MFTKFFSIDRMALLALGALGASACSDAATSGSTRPFTVSVTTASQVASQDRASADVTVSVGSGTLVVTKAQLVARKIELAPSNAPGSSCESEADDDGSADGDVCPEVETGPMLVDLPLDAATRTDITAAVPAGTYRAVEIKIDPITSGNRRSQDFLATHPEFQGYSVRIEGTYNGRPFVFRGAVDASLEMAFSTPITIDASNKNVTVAIDIASWFSDGAGGTLDPSSSANAGRIVQNVSRSFRAFEDDDRDGHEDSHR